MATAKPDAAHFRNVMGNIATPVSVVTAFDGNPHGTTVSAFASLSADPPMVLVSLDTRSNILAVISRTGRFAINVLADAQVDLALNFAVKGDDKFEGVTWGLQDGLPRLSRSSSWITCTSHKMIEGGDHVVIFGEVGRLDLDESKRPMTYHRRVFGTHSVNRQIAH
ncbi:MAG: flavin reductase [Gordonia sp.]|nr:flavin reductase [Gordonia sp. (in: high G+C Gram-positive bacteria)]